MLWPKTRIKTHYILRRENNLCGYGISKFSPTGRVKWIDPKMFQLNKYTSNSSKWCALEVDLKHPKELRESHSDHLLVPDKREVSILIVA